MHISTRRAVDRRTFLHAGGVALALPWLDAMTPAFAAAAAPKRRMVCIMTPLGLHTENLFPQQTGRGYTASRYLQPLDPLREKFTVFSGLSHPGVDGGHASEHSFLTAAPHPLLPSFRNTVSLDQFAAERIGGETRHASLTLALEDAASLSWTRNGVHIPGEKSPARLFAKLFLTDSPQELQRTQSRLKSGRSIMDTVGAEAKRFARALGPRDQDKLDEYFTSVRELEQKMVQAESWTQQPKPQVSEKPFVDIADRADQLGRIRLNYDLMRLALQTDSTRLITLHLFGTSEVVFPIPGVNTGHHDLSHHGKSPEKLRQLALVEEAEIKVFGEFLTKLAASGQAESSLLDETMVLFGSNLGNASSHDTRNMPIILAGGGFKHGQHLAFDLNNPPPLCNLYVQMLQRLGVETDQFATSNSAGLPGFTV